MMRLSLALAMMVALFFGTMARAQDRVWVQIEALPTLAEAEDRARAYAALFPEVSGFRLPSGWYAIALGPYDVAQGAAQLAGLKRENLIPRDSFIEDGRNYREAFWPAGAAPLTPPAAVTAEPVPEAAPEIAVEPQPEPQPAVIEESPEEARRGELALSDDERKLLQTALKWFGHYDSTIDGAFGRGTRASMGAWQAAMGLEPTGILTSMQRATLVANYQADIAEFGFQDIAEGEAGINVTLPMALVEFDHYEPPFVHFREKAGSGLRIILISQPGDRAALYGLYDVLQTLEIMPLTGERSRTERSFSLTGQSATVSTTAFAELKSGLIKGWIVVSSPEHADRDARILQVLQSSFAAVGDRALDPGMVPLDAAARRGLMAGLEVRRPKLSRSGFYVDGAGTVLTTTEAVAGCGRVTLDRATDADVVFADTALGLAALKPQKGLAPATVAGFPTAAERTGAEVAVAGYSYEDKLPSPVLTFGTLEEGTGLNGEAGLKRLTVTVLPGDAGGPVVDGSGALVGMLLPRAADGTRQLPGEVAFALSAEAIATRLAAAGLTPRSATATGGLAPEDLSRAATGMTVLVSCWE